MKTHGFLTRLLALSVCTVFLGCATEGPSSFSQSSVSTAGMIKSNYRVLRSNLRGESYGFRFLMFIPIVSPSMADAKQEMYDQLRREGIKLEGRAIALANATVDRSGIYFLIGSIPRVILTADVIEFIDEPSSDSKPAGK